MKRAVVLLSGGLDSTTTLAICIAQDFEAYALSFDYKQRHSIEVAAAKHVAKALGAREHRVAQIDLRIFGGSALTDDDLAVPKHGHSEPSAAESSRNAGRQAEAGLSNPVALSAGNATGSLGCAREDSARIPITYVPARNTIFLSYALAWAEMLQAADIFIGANAVDYSGYPDCRPEYIAAFENLANLATKAGIEGMRFHIRAPLLSCAKAEIIRRGVALGVDFSLTHSCYDPPADGIACGGCDACQLRLRGFREAGVADPLIYANR